MLGAVGNTRLLPSASHLPSLSPTPRPKGEPPADLRAALAPSPWGSLHDEKDSEAWLPVAS